MSRRTTRRRSAPDMPTTTMMHLDLPPLDETRLRERFERSAGPGDAHRVHVMERGPDGRLHRWRPPLRRRIARKAGSLRFRAALLWWRARQVIRRG